jgi:hypothetical protein
VVWQAPTAQNCQMTIALAAEEIECFRSLVVRCLGLYFEDAKLDMLASVLRQRMKSTGCDLSLAYRQRLTSAASGCEEICALASSLRYAKRTFSDRRNSCKRTPKW